MGLKITLVYVHPCRDIPDQIDRSCRFVESYHNYPPLFPHKTVIVLNGGELSGVTDILFATMPNLSFYCHDDIGWDIGAYRAVAAKEDCDLLFCMGGNSYVKKAGWLRRIADAYHEFGSGIFGTMASNEVMPHLRSTGIAYPPKLLREYPLPTITREQRYEFEHGRRSICRLAATRNIPVILVTWNGFHTWKEWRNVENGFRSGNQSNCLTYDKNSDDYAWTTLQRRQHLQKLSDAR